MSLMFTRRSSSSAINTVATCLAGRIVMGTVTPPTLRDSPHYNIPHPPVLRYGRPTSFGTACRPTQDWRIILRVVVRIRRGKSRPVQDSPPESQQLLPVRRYPTRRRRWLRPVAKHIRPAAYVQYRQPAIRIVGIRHRLRAVVRSRRRRRYVVDNDRLRRRLPRRSRTRTRLC